METETYSSRNKGNCKTKHNTDRQRLKAVVKRRIARPNILKAVVTRGIARPNIKQIDGKLHAHTHTYI